MSIIVAGGAGFIGSNFIKKILSFKSEIFILDNLSKGKLSFIPELNTDKKIRFIKCDLSELDSIKKVFQDIIKLSSYEIEVWHFAANSNIPAGVTNAQIDLKDTFMTTFNLLECCKKYKIKSFYFASSSAVYGDHGKAPLKEETGPLMPISNYGSMKLSSEALCFAAYENFLKKLRIYRFPNVIGAPATHGVIFDFINKLKVNNNQLNVLGNGSQKKSYLHVEDLIEGMLFLAQDKYSQDQNPIFNLGQNHDQVSVKWIAEETIKMISPKTKILYGKEIRGWIGDVPNFFYDTKKAFDCGWQAKLNSKDAIKKAIIEIYNQLK